MDREPNPHAPPDKEPQRSGALRTVEASAWISWALFCIVVFILFLRVPDLRHSARANDLFAGLPIVFRFWMFATLGSIVLGSLLMLLTFAIHSACPIRLRSRFSYSFGPVTMRGSVAALVVVVSTFGLLGLLLYLSMVED